MNIVELIKSRRTIQAFSDAKIPDAILHNAVEAAIYAPNHKLTWPWFFIRIGFNARARLADLQVNLKAKKSAEPLSPVAQQAVRQKFMEAPELLAVGIKRADNAGQQQEDYAALACAVQNMALYLWSEKIGTKWSSGAIIRASETYKILQLNEQVHELGGLISIGYPKTVPPTPPRPPLDRFYTTVS